MIIEHKGIAPKLADDVRLLDGAVVIGDTHIGKGSSVWFNSVIRGDVNSIRIGENVNIQDLSMVHCTRARFSTTIGDNVVVGHKALIHGCTIGNNVLVGMGSIIMDGSEIGDNTIIGAGALILEGKTYPPGVLIVGSPAVVKRELREEEIMFIQAQCVHYRELAAQYDDAPRG